MQKPPFIGGENARDDIKGDQPFLSFRIAIDRESNADTPEHDFSLAPAQIEQIRLDGFQPAGEFGIGWPNCPQASALPVISSNMPVARRTPMWTKRC